MVVSLCIANSTRCLTEYDGQKGIISGDAATTIVDGQERTLSQADLAEQAALTAPAPPRDIVIWGDSLSTDTYGRTLARLLVGRKVIMHGVPGEDGAQISKRFFADQSTINWINVVWDRHWTNESVKQYMAELKPMIDALKGQRFIVISDIRRLSSDNATDDIASDAASVVAMNKALVAAYPDNFLDVTSFLEDPTTRADGLHLTPQGYDAVANAIAEFVKSKGW